MVVVVDDEFAVRRPVQQCEVAFLAELQRLRFVQTILVAQHQHMAHAGVGDVGHLLAVGAPQGVFLPHARGLRQVAHRAILDGHGEHIAACRDHHPFAGGRQAGRGDVGAGVLPLGTRLHGLRRNLHGDVLGGAARHVDFLQAAACFIHHGIAGRARAAHIPYRLFGELLQRLGLWVVDKQIGRAVVAVRDEDHALADPQRVGVAGVDMGDLLPGVGHRVHDPDRRRAAAAALAPAGGAGVGRAVGPVGQALAIGRPGALERLGLHDLGFKSAVDWHFVQLVAAAIGHFARRGEQHAFAVGAPAIDGVDAGMPGQALGVAAADGHHIHIGVAVVTGREGNPLAIGRKGRRKLVGRVRSQAHRVGAVALADPDIAALDKGQVVARDGRLAQQLRRGLLGGEGQAHGGTQQRDKAPQPGGNQIDHS